MGYRSAFYEYHQRGEVMHARYPNQVGGDNLEIQSYVTQESPFGTMFATWWPFANVIGRCLEDTWIPKRGCR